MSEENVALVRQIYASRGLEASLRFYAEDVVWDMSDRALNPRIYHGHEGVREWRRELREVWDAWRNEPERLVDGGDRVVAIIRSIARGHGSGVELSERWAQVWTIRDGKVVHLRHYRDPDEALAAAGLGQ